MHKNSVKNATIGSDIEVFLQHKETKEIISAEPYIKGSKHFPFVFDETNPFFTLSLDNVLAEFTIPPAKSLDEWMEYIHKSLGYLNTVIPKEYCTAPLPSAILNEKYLQTKAAKLFGCEPDANVWLRSPNPSPKASNPFLRSAGGHIHIGYDNPTLEVNEWLIKAMDLYIGVPSVLQEPDNDRKLLYGKAGAFRFKPYGVEYRTVSNYYLQNDKTTAWVFNNTQKAISFVNEGNVESLDFIADMIQSAINNADKKLAEKIVKDLNINLA